MREMLDEAEAREYAIGNFVAVDLQFVQAIIETAVECQSPVIIALAAPQFGFVALEDLAPALTQIARKAPVPVCLHLDHGRSISDVVRAIRCGFTSVMYDASAKSFEQNVEEVQAVVTFARSVGITVEAELGRVTGGEEGTAPSQADPRLFTDPAEAERFMQLTDVDALAVSVGNVHGVYEGQPQIDFDRLAEIRRRTGIPLVLHGGSGISREDFRRAIDRGVRKINIFTAANLNAVRYMEAAIRDHPETVVYPHLMDAAKRGVRETTREMMETFGTCRECAAANAYCPTFEACDEARGNGSDLDALVSGVTRAVIRQIGDSQDGT